MAKKVRKAARKAAGKREQITDEQLHHTFQTNIFAYFYVTHEALPHLGSSGRIVNG